MNDQQTDETRPPHCLVTGGTGFIGRHLVKKLVRPVVAGRNPKMISRVLGDVIPCHWKPDQQLDPACLEGVDAVFHLAGESVYNSRWNEDKKELIVSSRIEGTRNLVKSLAALEKPPGVLVCASAIGYYGDRGEEVLTEESPAGSGFLAELCRSWEEQALQAEAEGIRTVLVRIGIVLGEDGGALAQMLMPFKLGLGGWLGSGRQYMSWIHIDDLVGLMLHAAAVPGLSGAVNGVAPNPVTNREFTSTLASVLSRPAVLPVPGFILKALLGEFGEVLLSSQRVKPERITRSGFAFDHPVLKAALHNILQ